MVEARPLDEMTSVHEVLTACMRKNSGERIAPYFVEFVHWIQDDEQKHVELLSNQYYRAACFLVQAVELLEKEGEEAALGIRDSVYGILEELALLVNVD